MTLLDEIWIKATVSQYTEHPAAPNLVKVKEGQYK